MSSGCVTLPCICAAAARTEHGGTQGSAVRRTGARVAHLQQPRVVVQAGRVRQHGHALVRARRRQLEQHVVVGGHALAHWQRRQQRVCQRVIRAAQLLGHALSQRAALLPHVPLQHFGAVQQVHLLKLPHLPRRVQASLLAQAVQQAIPARQAGARADACTRVHTQPPSHCATHRYRRCTVRVPAPTNKTRSPREASFAMRWACILRSPRRGQCGFKRLRSSCAAEKASASLTTCRGGHGAVKSLLPALHPHARAAHQRHIHVVLLHAFVQHGQNGLHHRTSRAARIVSGCASVAATIPYDRAPPAPVPSSGRASRCRALRARGGMSRKSRAAATINSRALAHKREAAHRHL